MNSESMRKKERPEGESPPESRPISRRLMIINGISLTVTAAAGVLLIDACRKKNALEIQLAELDAKREAIRQAHSIPRSAPEKLTSDPELQRMLEEKFDVIAGNASIEDAKIIGIGELHSHLGRGNPYGEDAETKRQAHEGRAAIGKFLEKTTKKGDHFLLEAKDRTEGDLPSVHFLPMSHHWAIAIYDKEITASGWDDVDLLRDTSRPVKEVMMERNGEAMIPSMLQSAKERFGKVFIVAGASHFLDDPRVDEVMEREKIPYLLLGEKNGVKIARSLYERVPNRE